MSTLLGITVLVVEDDLDTLELYSVFLAGLGADVLVASNSGEARAVLQRVVPHVIVCDVGLPVEDGHALLRWVRGNDATRAVPAIALTGYPPRPLAPSDFELHLLKPVAIDAVARAVASLGRRGCRAPD